MSGIGTDFFYRNFRRLLADGIRYPIPSLSGSFSCKVGDARVRKTSFEIPHKSLVKPVIAMEEELGKKKAHELLHARVRRPPRLTPTP